MISPANALDVAKTFNDVHINTNCPLLMSKQKNQ